MGQTSEENTRFSLTNIGRALLTLSRRLGALKDRYECLACLMDLYSHCRV